jgi:hypothetical protein
MARLLWDQAGDRVYETGIDRGVLYSADGSAVAWNGLASVSEKRNDAKVNSYYLDGVKYLDVSEGSDYSATLTAYTYPDEFLPCDGFADIGSGVLIDNQIPQEFSLSYRTQIGNDTTGPNYGYKIHLLYNLLAVPSDRDYSSIGDSIEPLKFTWDIVAVPIDSGGYRPSAHYIVDTTKNSAYGVEYLEDLLYGTYGKKPVLLDPSDIVDALENPPPADLVTDLVLDSL